jgi:hypothetical protein
VISYHLYKARECFFSIAHKGKKKVASGVCKRTCLVKEEVPSFATTTIALNNSQKILSKKI